jgi:hypothetical protein
VLNHALHYAGNQIDKESHAAQRSNRGRIQAYRGGGPGDPPSKIIYGNGLTLSWSFGFTAADYTIGFVSSGSESAFYYSGTQKGQWFNFGGELNYSLFGMTSTDGQPLTLDDSFRGESQKIFYSGGEVLDGSISILSNPGNFASKYVGLELGAGPGGYVLPFGFGYGRTDTGIWKIPKFTLPSPYKMTTPSNQFTNPFRGGKF